MTTPPQPTEKDRRPPGIGVPMSLETKLSNDQVLDRLDAAARRGKLAGFSRGREAGVLFTVTDYGGPFESVLEARATARERGIGLEFTSRIKPVAPAIFAFSLALSVWPGVWLTDSLIRTYFTGYDFPTWVWYLPLTAPFCPWAYWIAVKKSRASANAELEKIMARIAGLLDAPAPVPGTTVQSPEPIP